MTDKKSNKNTPMPEPIQTSEQMLVTANKHLSVRLNLASAFHSMWIKAYDALLHNGINVRDLPEYKDTAMLDKALDTDIERGQGHIMEYIKRVESGMVAAIRRKHMRPV